MNIEKNKYFKFDTKIIPEILKEIFNDNHQIIYDDDNFLEIHDSIKYFETFLIPEFLYDSDDNDDYCCFKFKVYEFNSNIEMKYFWIIKYKNLIKSYFNSKYYDDYNISCNKNINFEKILNLLKNNLVH